MAAGLVPLLNPTATIPPKEPDLGVDPIAVAPIPDPIAIPYVQSLVSDDARITITPEGPSVGETPSSQGNLVIDSSIQGGEYPTIWLDVNDHLTNAGASWTATETMNWYIELSGYTPITMPNPTCPDGFIFILCFIRRGYPEPVVTFDKRWRFPDGVTPSVWITGANRVFMSSCVYLSHTTLVSLGGTDWAKFTNGAVFISQPTEYLYLRA